MKSYIAQPLFNVFNALGEGPLWHPEEKRLYWTDIITGTLYRSNTALTTFEKKFVEMQVGAFAFCKNNDLILATNLGFWNYKFEQNESELLWNPLPAARNVRLNDGKVDPAGRFWAGSMDTQNQKGELYRFDPDGSKHTILRNIGISNGLGWSPDLRTMYYTDSIQYTIFQFEYDITTGAIINKQPFIKLPKDRREIVPDGLCVDKEGNIWSAQWNGWQVVKYNPDGIPIANVSVPAQRVTSCCFGGDNLDTLFITTSRADLTEKELFNQPQAGDIFFCQVEEQGQTTNKFG